MRAAEVRKAFRVRPYRPLEVELESGTRHVVRHPENIIVLRSWVFIVLDREDFVLTAPSAITSIRPVRRNGRQSAT